MGLVSNLSTDIHLHPSWITMTLCMDMAWEKIPCAHLPCGCPHVEPCQKFSHFVVLFVWHDVRVFVFSSFFSLLSQWFAQVQADFFDDPPPPNNVNMEETKILANRRHHTWSHVCLFFVNYSVFFCVRHGLICSLCGLPRCIGSSSLWGNSEAPFSGNCVLRTTLNHHVLFLFVHRSGWKVTTEVGCHYFSFVFFCILSMHNESEMQSLFVMWCNSETCSENKTKFQKFSKPISLLKI